MAAMSLWNACRSALSLPNLLAVLEFIRTCQEGMQEAKNNSSSSYSTTVCCNGLVKSLHSILVNLYRVIIRGIDS